MFIQVHINHITKVEFLFTYHAAYNKVMSKENITGGFQGTGLISHNPEVVISKLDIKIHTPEGLRLTSANFSVWELKTPQNLKEAI